MILGPRGKSAKVELVAKKPFGAYVYLGIDFSDRDVIVINFLAALEQAL